MPVLTIPVLDGGGETVGTLCVQEEGLYRVLRARVSPLPGLHRLWLCGEGGACCLGVLSPDGSSLRLEKRLSRAAWSALPHPLRRAALAPPAEAEPAPVTEDTPTGAAPPALPSPEPCMRSVRLFGRQFVVFRS